MHYPKTIRERVNNRFESTIRNRVNSRNTPIIIIMQRLHEHDLCGYLQQISGYARTFSFVDIGNFTLTASVIEHAGGTAESIFIIAL